MRQPEEHNAQLQAQIPALDVRMLNLKGLLLRRQSVAVLVLGTLAMLVAFNLYTLLSMPAPFQDEGWGANRSWALLHTGRAFGSLDSGVFEYYPGYWTYFPLLASVIHAASILVFGPTLLAMRVVSMVFGVALLLVVYIVASQVRSRRTGIIAVGLLATSLPFLFSSHLGRHDIIVAAFGYGAIALYVTEQSNKLSAKSLLCGLLIGLTLDIHLNGMLFLPVILSVYLVDYGWLALRTGRLWGFILGFLAGVLYFVALHILPYPQSFFDIARVGNGISRVPPLLSLDPALWLSALEDTITLMGLPAALLVVASLAVLLKKPSRSDLKLVALFAVTFLIFSALIRVKAYHYLILLAPAASMLVASMFDRIMRANWRGNILLSLRLAAVIGLLLASLIETMQLFVHDSSNDYNAAYNSIKSTIPPGSTAIGLQTWWFALTDSNYLSWEQITYYRRFSPGISVADALQKLHPDYMIIDKRIESYLTDDQTVLASDINNSAVPRPELNAFLKQQAHLVAHVPTETYGNVQIYKIDWQGSSAASYTALAYPYDIADSSDLCMVEHRQAIEQNGGADWTR